MIRLNGKWMFYVTLYNSARDSAIAVFSSDNATGPFEDMHVITRSKETNIKDTIDPEVVKDPDTGKLWLFFGSIGKMHRVELKPDGLSVVDNAQYVHVAGLDSDQNRSRSKFTKAAICIVATVGGIFSPVADGTTTIRIRSSSAAARRSTANSSIRKANR